MKSWIGTPVQRNCNFFPKCASCRSPSRPVAPWTLPFHASKMRPWHGVGTPLGIAACGAMAVLCGSAFGSGRQSGESEARQEEVPIWRGAPWQPLRRRRQA